MPSKHGPRVDAFYHGKAWKRMRQRIIDERAGLCEKCGKKGTEVHHIIELNDENVTDPSIALNPKNLMLLCRACHDAIRSPSMGRCLFDENGNVMSVEARPPICRKVCKKTE